MPCDPAASPRSTLIIVFCILSGSALNDDNTAKPKRVDAVDTMNLAQMTKILASVASSS